MALKISNVKLMVELPALPPAIPVFSLAAPSFDERRTAIDRLGEHLKLGALRSVELDHATVMASKRGDIHYFHASGAILARDATARRGAENELRKWEGLQDSKSGGQRITLNSDAAKRLISQARAQLEPIGLLDKEVASETVHLEQVANLDEQGNEVQYGAGKATVRFGYSVEGVPVRGPGAKTLVFAEPESDSARITGAFHAFRRPLQSTALSLLPVDEALGVGVLSDPELNLYHAAGHQIQITRLDFVYLALPAFMRQTHLIPAFQVEGKVSEGERGIAFGFARFHHAAPPKAYASADIVGSYLTMNPDGIGPHQTLSKRSGSR
jgi:hypothetical protein